MNHFTLGLDVGITSIGWSVMDMEQNKLIDLGVRLFEEAKPAASSRDFRSARRTLRRKKWRKNQLKKAFIDFGLLSQEIIDQKDYLSFTVSNEHFQRPEDETVYHLRLRALHERVTIRELLLALYNICKTRGHFLMETVNFDSKEGITYELFRERFYQTVEEYVHFKDKDDFEAKILRRLFAEGKIPKTECTKLLKNGYGISNEDDVALKQIIFLLSGFKANLSEISEQAALPDVTKTIDILTLIKKDELNDFLNAVIELHDMIEVSKVLQKYQYICELDVDKLNQVSVIQAMQKTDPDRYKSEVKTIQNKMKIANPDDILRVIKNIENKYPNGLYVKEARAILRKQQEYYPELISNAFIEVCISIIQARIPYYIGPLSMDAKHAWLVKKDKFKYSYAYSKEQAVDEFQSIKNWKLAMISRCTYLPDEFALPKGSFIAETFNILNELNVLQAVDQNENSYQLTQNDKLRILDQLFLRQKQVKYQEIAELLNLKSFGTRRKSGLQKFRSGYTLYHQIRAILPSYQLETIDELFKKTEKIERLEELILNINLFDEEASKLEFLGKDEAIGLSAAKKLAKLSSSGFYAFSKKFIMDTPMNETGQSLLEELFDDNVADYTNEQMTLISQAKDTAGNPVHFDSNKYMDKLKKGKHLSVDLLIEKGKPFIPVSRPVIRALNECFKLYEEIIRTYGVPKRVVIETARDLKDSSRLGEIPAKHFDEMKRCFDYLQEQLKKPEKKLYDHKIEDWDKISTFLNRNKRKIELYIRQNGLDMISGDPIDLDHLTDYEMDHILPRGFGDNSMDNLMLIHKTYNAMKGDRVPLEYIENGHVTNKAGKTVTTGDFLRRVNELFELRMISEKKVKQLQLASAEEAFGFINRNLVDTRYIIKELMAILRAYHTVHEYDTHIVSLKSAFTSIYRQALRFQKNRDIGTQHHAHDAAIIAIADHVLSTYYPNYDQRGNQSAYHRFIEQIIEQKGKNEQEKSEQSKINDFIEFAYYKAYGDLPTHPGSMVSQVKASVPLYSIKAEKKYTGELFNATILKPSKVDEKSPLSILGVNNDIHAFSSVNCAAVDFYKVPTKKGQHKHVAIHIPKVIVHADGTIDKEKYIALVRDFYKETILLDEHGEIKEFYFKLRLFKNDLVYDTEHHMIQKFNIGSIALKKLEMKHIYQFSYDEIYEQVWFMRKALCIHFDMKLRHINPSGKTQFKDLPIQKVIEFCLDNLMDINDKERYKQSIVKILEQETSMQSFLEKAAFIQLIVNRSCTPPTIIGRNCPTATAVNGDEQYIKIKSTILGIRWQYNENGNLMISGPNGAIHKYSKIRKEPFSWKICKSVIE